MSYVIILLNMLGPQEVRFWGEADLGNLLLKTGHISGTYTYSIQYSVIQKTVS